MEGMRTQVFKMTFGTIQGYDLNGKNASSYDTVAFKIQEMAQQIYEKKKKKKKKQGFLYRGT